MFGQQKFGSSPFGQNQQSFGKPAAFGTTSFGQQPTLFPQPTTGVFGQPAPSFGAPAPAFGQPATTQSAFGSFGQPQQQPTTSLFGQTQPAQASTSLFGQPSTSTGFGAPKPTSFGGFGNTNQSTLFGQPSTSTTNTGFGTFGSTGTSAFSTPQTMSANGTAIAKYQPHSGTDTLMKNGQTNNVSTRQHCITAMKEYEGKSLEELRMEDYTANRKGPQAGAVQPTGLFGTTPQNTSIFGAPASQPQSTGLFGTQSTTNTMGGFGSNTSTFGQTAPAFGAQNQTPSLFNKPASTFGQPTFNQQPASNVFGAKPFGTPTTTASTAFAGFGQPAANTATPFGAPKPFGQQTTGIFGSTTPAQPGTTFGTSTTSFGTGAFGAAAPTTSQPGSLFGQPAQTGSSIFGQTSTAPNTGFVGFGNPTNTAAGGLFGTKPTTGFASTFGTPASSTSTGFSGLGTFTPAGGSAFGTFGQQSTFNKPAGTGFTGFNTTSTAPTLGGSSFGALGTNTMGFGASTSLQPAQQTTVPVHQHILSLATSPYGDNPIFKDLKPLGSLNEDALKPTNPAAQKAILESTANQYKISPKVSNELKVKPVASTLSKKSLFGGLEEFDSSIDGSFSLKPNAKRLIIKPKVTTPSSLAPNPNNSSIHIPRSQETSPINADERGSSSQLPTTSTEPENSRRVSWLHSNLDKVSQQNRGDTEINTTIQELVSSGKSKPSSIDKLNTSPGILRQDPNRSIISSMQHKTVHFPGLGLNANDSILSTKSFLDDTNADISLINTEPHSAGIILQRSGYYTIPPLDKLADFMTDDGKCIVPNLTIGRNGYGNVYFGEPIDVAGLNLDELVHFRHKEVIIYPDDENKPPVGEGLNRKAQITLDQVWPHDKTLHEPIKDRERLAEMNYESKLRAVCDKHDTRFVEYRPETGSWVFKVDHFSKYGLSDSDEEDNAGEAKKLKPNQPGKDGLKSTLTASTGLMPKKSLKDTALQRDSMFSNSKFMSLTAQRTGAFNELVDDREREYMSFGQYSAHPTSPSTDLAMDMGTDPTKVQVMRASFFNTMDDDVDEYETKSVNYENFGDRDSPDQIVPNKRHFTFSSTHSLLSKEVSSTTSSSSNETPMLSPQLPFIRDEPKKGELLSVDGKKLMSTKTFKPIPLVLKPKVATIRASDKIVPLNESIQSKLQTKSIASDCALFHSRRFKIGWSHANRLTILTTALTGKHLKQFMHLSDVSSVFSGRLENDTSKCLIKQLKIFSLQPNDPDTFETTIRNHLECQLSFTQKQTVADSDCPYLVPINGIESLQSHFSLAERNSEKPLNDFQKISLNVWSLLRTLWGYQEELDDDDMANDDHFAIMLRRDLFSKWLEDTVTDNNLLKRSESQGRYLQKLLNLLTAHKVNEACELAFDNGDMNLSLLLAQTGGGNVVRALIAKQLQSWRETEADKFIDIHRLKAMMLVTGMSTYESSQGVVNIYEDLDWVKSLAINVWYLCSPTASITDALLKYEEATVTNASPPSPSYMKDYDAGCNMDRIQDIRYHILKLYSRRSHSLEKLLNPATHTADFMDFRLSWLLLQVLKSIGYQHCSEQSEAQLHVSFASQLENYGLWHWSIFVLLHIPNQSQRELAIQEILYRYIDLTKNEEFKEKESFIVNKLGIPEKWIYWAKAVKAGALKQYREQADYLLKAKQWALAHEVIMNQIAPDAIINDNTRYIKDLLDRFEDPRLVPNWANQGMIILDYLDMIAKIESLKTIHERDIETRWEGLKPQLSELCSRINQFPCPTSKHRLCQSEIAQGLAILVNGMEILSSDINPCLLVQTALEKLPLPEEYAKQKMRSLLDNSTLIEMLQNDDN